MKLLTKLRIGHRTLLKSKKIGLQSGMNAISALGRVCPVPVFYKNVDNETDTETEIDHDDFSKILLKIEYFPVKEVFIDCDAKLKVKLLPEKITLNTSDNIFFDDMTFYSYKKFSLPSWFFGITKKNKIGYSEWNNFEVFADKVEFDSKNILLNDIAYNSLTIDNAGGSSAYSEALSIEYFIRKFKADDFIYENQVSYWVRYKMCDFVCSIQGEKIGVSVTRAMNFGLNVYTLEDAYNLLKKKIEGLIIARSGVSECHSFQKSILHIWCQSEYILMCCNEMSKKYIKEHPCQISLKGLRIILTLCDTTLLYDDKQAKIIITEINAEQNN